jgi:hypothetical protein
MTHNSTQDSYSTNPGDFIRTPLPDWNIPENWCLPDALQQVQNVGKWLLSQGLLAFHNSNADPRVHPHRIRVEFISDTSHRDVDTAFAMAQGMADDAQKQQPDTVQVQVRGLSQLHYDHWLFKPWEMDPTSTFGNQTLCRDSYSPEEQEQAILEHLQAMPPPTTLTEICAFLMEKGGIGTAGNLTQLFPMDRFILSHDLKNFLGIASLVKLFAQMAFYSRAGNLSSPFLPTLSTNEVYDLLQWVHWSRTITQAYTPNQAASGSVMAQVMLRVLERGSLYPTYDDEDGDYAAYVTIVVGHDGNIEDLVTALGASYVAPAPYRTSTTTTTSIPYVVTPPVSGIYAYHDLMNRRMDLGFVTPVYSQLGRDDNDWLSNASGILEFVPLHQRGTNQPLLDRLSQGNHHPTEALRQHITQVLEQYTGSMDCFMATEDFLHKLSMSSPDTEPTSLHVGWITVVLLVVVTTAITGLWCLVSHRRHRLPQQFRQQNYAGVDVSLDQSSGPDVHDTELI